MQISDKHIEEFQKIWKNKFNEEIGKEEAIEKCNSMVNLIKLIYRPIKKSDLNKNDKKRYKK